nr:MAG TPA: hypothetical protein [Caudoviricetes sp.]
MNCNGKNTAKTYFTTNHLYKNLYTEFSKKIDYI